jgi:hypothetical protein
MADEDWEPYDDGLDPDGDGNDDLGDFTIMWVEAEKRFEPATIRARLTVPAKGVDVPHEVDHIELEPKDVVELVPDPSQSTPTIAVFRARLTDAVMSDRSFYDKVARPVKVRIVVKPVPTATSPVPVDPEPVERSCRVGVKVPPARIRWEDHEHPGVPDPRFDVEADGEDDMELHVWFERWDPARKTIATDFDVEFSHMTNEQFDPEVFGPHPESRPWVIAQPPSGDPRFCSLWKSMMALPHPERRETLPWDGMIRVRAWRDGDITARSVNRIRVRPGARPLAQAFVPVRLGPARIEARLVEPEEPVPADGQPHDIVIQFVTARTKKPVESGTVSWELATGARYPGGTLDPLSAVLTPSDQGKVRIAYTPPKLVYTPGAAYDQDIKCFVGSGEKRQEAGGVIVYVSPEVRAELSAKKCGLDFDPPYTLVIPAAAAPDRIEGHVGFVSLQPDVPEQFDVFDALPLVAALPEGARCDLTIDTRTDDKGRYRFTLPELTPGLARLAEDSARRRRVLEAFREESAGDFDDLSLQLLDRYRNRLRNNSQTFARLLTGDLLHDLAYEPVVFGRHLCTKPEADCEKCKEGMRILEAALAGTVLVDMLQEHLLDLGLKCLADFMAALLDVVLSFTKLAEKLFGLLGKMAGKMAPWMWPLVRGPLNVLLRIAERWFPIGVVQIRLTIDALERGTVNADQALGTLWQEAQTAMSAALVTAIQRTADYAKAALASTAGAGSVGNLGSGARDKAINAVADLLIGLVRNPTSADAARTGREALRDILGLQPMDAAARGAVGATVRNFDGFAYAGQPGTAKLYLDELQAMVNQLNGVETWQGDVKFGWDVVAAAADFVMNVALVIAIGSALMAPFTAGQSLWATGGALAARVLAAEVVGKVKSLVAISIVLYRAFLLIGAHGELVKAYELRTLAMTGSR